MRNALLSFFLLFTFLPLVSEEIRASNAYYKATYHYNIGDVFTINENGTWRTAKILDIDTNEQSSTIHALLYSNTKQKPTLTSLDELSILAYHSTIAHARLEQKWQFIGNDTPLKHELKGYINYLKHHDFNKYAEATNQKVDDLIFRANTLYTKGYALNQAAQYKQAIEAYKQAVNIYPLYFEAIDNIGFAYMDMGDFQTAISYFEQSLKIHPKGTTAQYYKGMCYINLEDYDSARHAFKQGMENFPQQKHVFEEIYIQLEQNSF
ncbi:tetratricopeptide repeat protein [Pseudoalteromonas luteoviolacea]|uniref:tetratricopeptide repeat protein n=1 Tax=Pseudoalteromonas luteoviolacea TaxID=43657 RepID=UPI001F2DA9B4|nr:tetratricopeptide repeat protein [Pseudoalteromonas luteoviolacea]MCF6441315.1 tetratricopeptide repeat protein [Pseudoalteromonas luteoviolacea]